MVFRIYIFFIFSSLVACIGGNSTDSIYSDDKVLIGTSLGEIEMQLYPERSPITVANFLEYVDKGFYDGRDGQGATTFHRVVVDFVVQGGGWTDNGIEKRTFEPIVNEAADNGLSNLRGTVAMARTMDPDSATSQFYINLIDNLSLDASSDSAGYAVFGQVLIGMDIVDTIGEAAVDSADALQEPVVIESMTRKLRD